MIPTFLGPGSQQRSRLASSVESGKWEVGRWWKAGSEMGDSVEVGGLLHSDRQPGFSSCNPNWGTRVNYPTGPHHSRTHLQIAAVRGSKYATGHSDDAA